MGQWLRLEPGGTDGGLLFSMVDRQAEVGLEVTLQGGLQQMHVSVYGAAEGGSRLLRRAAPPERCTLSGLELVPGRWHHLIVCFRRRSKWKGQSEAFALLDGRRCPLTPCAFPAFPPRGDATAAQHAHVGCHVGACDERRGFEGQLGTLLLMRGCASDGEAAVLYRAGTRCAEPDATLAAANGGLHLLSSSRACVVTAAFDAATLDGSKCDAVHLRVGAGVGAAGVEGGGLCGLPTAGGTLRVGAGVEVLRQL